MLIVLTTILLLSRGETGPEESEAALPLLPTVDAVAATSEPLELGGLNFGFGDNTPKTLGYDGGEMRVDAYLCAVCAADIEPWHENRGEGDVPCSEKHCATGAAECGCGIFHWRVHPARIRQIWKSIRKIIR